MLLCAGGEESVSDATLSFCEHHASHELLHLGARLLIVRVEARGSEGAALTGSASGTDCFGAGVAIGSSVISAGFCTGGMDVLVRRSMAPPPPAAMTRTIGSMKLQRPLAGEAVVEGGAVMLMVVRVAVLLLVPSCSARASATSLR